MDPVTTDIMRNARFLGMSLRRDRDRLVVRGPKHLGWLAEALLARKGRVLAVLDTEQDPAVAAALGRLDGHVVRVKRLKREAHGPGN